MKLLVRNLARTTTEDELRQLFLPFGPVTSCVLVMDSQTGQSKGFGFVTMDDEAASAARQALEGRRLGDQRIRVRVAAEPPSASEAKPPSATKAQLASASAAQQSSATNAQQSSGPATQQPSAPEAQPQNPSASEAPPPGAADVASEPPRAETTEQPNIWKSITRKRPETK